MKYEFGVMSSKYTLEAENDDIAYICMSLFIKQNIPIAVYSPISYAFMPKDILKKFMNVAEKQGEKLFECMISIESVKEDEM
jgi:hypothetical protein